MYISTASPGISRPFRERRYSNKGENVYPSEKPRGGVNQFAFLFLFAVAPAIVGLTLGLSLLSPFGLLLLLPSAVMGVFAAKTIRDVLEAHRKGQEGVHIYGLIIDDDNVVMRELTIFTRKNCIFLPRTSITSFYLTTEFDEAKGGSQRSSILRVAYQDDQDKVKWLTLVKANTLELKPYQLYDLLLVLNKNIQGEWSLFQPDFKDHPSDTILQFNEADGLIIEFLDDEKITEIPFTYRPTGDRTILIETAQNKPSPSPQLEPGSYNYEIDVEHRRQGKFYLVRFDGEFFESPLRTYGQKVEKRTNET